MQNTDTRSGYRLDSPRTLVFILAMEAGMRQEWFTPQDVVELQQGKGLSPDDPVYVDPQAIPFLLGALMSQGELEVRYADEAILLRVVYA